MYIIKYCDEYLCGIEDKITLQNHYNEVLVSPVTKFELPISKYYGALIN